VPKRAKLKPAGRCIYCGSGNLSKAHIWPAWLKQVLPTFSNTHENVVGEFRTFTSAVPGPAPSVEIRQGATFSRKLRIVCQDCNSGWCGNIEHQAKPVLAPLIAGQPAEISPTDQQKLALWFALVIVLLDRIDLRMAAIPQEDRSYIKTNLSPPPRWQMWIVKYDGVAGDEFVCATTGFLMVSDPSQISIDPERIESGESVCNSRVVTCCVGHLCMHALISGSGYKIGGYEGINLMRVWPSSQVWYDWKAATQVSHSDIIELAESVPRNARPGFPVPPSPQTYNVKRTK